MRIAIDSARALDLACAPGPRRPHVPLLAVAQESSKQLEAEKFEEYSVHVSAYIVELERVIDARAAWS
jgi:hypothetical protein